MLISYLFVVKVTEH